MENMTEPSSSNDSLREERDAMTLDERIEAAAITLGTYTPFQTAATAEPWIRFQMLPDDKKDEFRRRARSIVRTAVPELFNGSAWIAPTELTAAMESAWLRSPECEPVTIQQIYQLLRDAHLSQAKK